MSTPVANPHKLSVSPPSGVTVTLNTDGTVVIVQGGNTITLANLEAVRRLWQALGAAVG